ncbi:MAG: aryl-sulfate sulfotransferase [Bacteroidetes bacterium]|nr:aryl-sulfate sulfotransferase [Bacteroidota bacterium]
MNLFRYYHYALMVFCSILNAQSITVQPSTSAYVFSNGVSVPSDYPHISISVKNNPDSGFIFINNWGGMPYIAILDTNGEPVFYRKMPSNARDFKLQSNGNLSYRLADPYYRFYEMDSSYVVLREITAKNGFGTDEHDLQILPNDNVLLIPLEWKTVNMSTLVAGGRTDASVIGNHVQEIDPTGNVVFEWKSWDHLNIVDAVNENLTAQTIDFVHMNAIAVDNDSNILISSRHLSEITKINRKTGKIMWRLGGKHNQFTFINDPFNGPSYQHDIRALPNGNYTIMDNGNFHAPQVSRAVEYKLDTAAKTATLVWQYRHSPDRYTSWMGNVQRLPNGNTLINWADGSLPKLTEVTPAGVIVLELGFVNYCHSYRVFKFPWKGKAKAPELTLEVGTNNVTMIFNTFDQMPNHTYLLYIDTISHPVRLVDSTTMTAVDVNGLRNGERYYFRVTSRDSSGKESSFSNEENAIAKFFSPGENLVVNGDFANGLDEWKMNITSPGVGLPFITADGELFVQIGSAGTQAWHVQMTQEGIPVMNGMPYRFEFDAYATISRTIDPKVAMIAAPNTNYSKTGSMLLTTAKQHFSYDFTMQDATDKNARIVFNCGLFDADVFIDNVALKQIVPVSVSDYPTSVSGISSLQQNYPNPFNPETKILFTLAVSGYVTLTLHDVLGRTVATLINQFLYAGTQHITISQSRYGLTSGIYFYTLTSGSFSSTKRMVLLQ